jgi:hypothetical protein
LSLSGCEEVIFMSLSAARQSPRGP